MNIAPCKGFPDHSDSFSLQTPDGTDRRKDLDSVAEMIHSRPWREKSQKCKEIPVLTVQTLDVVYIHTVENILIGYLKICSPKTFHPVSTRASTLRQMEVAVAVALLVAAAEVRHLPNLAIDRTSREKIEAWCSNSC